MTISIEGLAKTDLSRFVRSPTPCFCSLSVKLPIVTQITNTIRNLTQPGAGIIAANTGRTMRAKSPNAHTRSSAPYPMVFMILLNIDIRLTPKANSLNFSVKRTPQIVYPGSGHEWTGSV